MGLVAQHRTKHKRGHIFKSETDTEVLIHLIEDVYEKNEGSLFDAVRLALNEVVGAYAIVVINKNNPNELIAAKKSSPLVVGIGDGEYFLASDATPIIEFTKNVFDLLKFINFLIISVSFCSGNKDDNYLIN